MTSTARPDVHEYRNGLGHGYNNLGLALAVTGDPAGAREAFGQAIAAREALVAVQPDVPEYQDGLAMSYYNLGNLLAGTTNLAGAQEAYGKAIAIYERLVGSYKDRPDYRSGLGGVLNNVGLILAAQGHHEEAIDHYRQAIGHQRAVFDRLPQVTQFRRFLSNHYFGLATSHRALGRADEAAEATRERIKLWPGNAVELYNGACELTASVPIAEPDRKEALAAEAVGVLRQAVEAGWSDASYTADDADLLALHGRPDFQRLLGEMFDRAFPKDPFAR